MMQRLLKYGGLVLLALIAMMAAGYLVWVPAPAELPYRLANSWGEKGSQPGQLHDPTGIVVTANEVFVSDARNHRLQVFSKQGEFLREFGNDVLGRPMNLEIANGTLYVADYWNDKIYLFSLKGELLKTFGSSGTGPGELKSPGGVAVDAQGNLYVADFYNHRIQKLTADGEFLHQWGKTGAAGSGAGEFSYPMDVAIAPSGHLIVADGYNDRIQVFDKSGKFLDKWGGPFARNISGPFRSWFAAVTSVATNGQGAIFAADFYNDRVQKFTASGEFLTAFGTRAEKAAHTSIAVAVDESGDVYVTNYDLHRIEKWTAP